MCKSGPISEALVPADQRMLLLKKMQQQSPKTAQQHQQQDIVAPITTSFPETEKTQGKHCFAPGCREEQVKLSAAIRQQNASLFVAHNQHEAQKLQHLVHDARQQVMRKVLKARAEAKNAKQHSRQLQQIATSKVGCVCSHCQSNVTDSSAALVKLVWDGQASNVEVRFNMDGWTKSHQMIRSPLSGVWELGLSLPTFARVQFKFIVDGQWQTSSRYDTCQDGCGNMNNTVLVALMEFGSLKAQDKVSVCSQVDDWATQQTLNWCNTRNSHALAVLVPGTWAGAFRFKFVVNGSWTLNSAYTSTRDGCFENNMFEF